MKISFSWLNDYIDLSDYKDRLEALGDVLTQAGLEVEGLEDPSLHWNKVTVGKIEKLDRHPDADRLTLCQVDIGEKTLSPIVCGATNHKAGDFVAVATPGAVLPGNFKIKKSKIRGVESFGMLCSLTELGLGSESEGILILEGGLKPGTPFKEAYTLTDAVFELNVTPNRADCLSHLGLARELSALLERPLKVGHASSDIDSSQPSSSGSGATDQTLVVGSRSGGVTVTVDDVKACPRYCGRVLRSITVKESPAWLKSRLEAVGINTHNNVVDITNYVMLEYGQPLHAFDVSQIKGKKLHVRKAKAEENFISLDGTNLELSTDDLLICDSERPVALAGVVGGANSGVAAETKDIFLEAAFFEAKGVRKTARYHGVETDACYRFSRGVDPSQTLNAMNRATALFVELAGGQAESQYVDVYPEPKVRSSFDVTADYVGQRLGFSVQREDLVRVCERLGCEVSSVSQNSSSSETELEDSQSLRITPPSYRWDLVQKEDIVEEYGRLVGYDKIEERLPPLVESPQANEDLYLKIKASREILAGLGCFEAVNYGFIPAGVSGTYWQTDNQEEPATSKSNGNSTGVMTGVATGDDSVTLANPLSEEFKVMRSSLLPGLLKNVQQNDRNGKKQGQLFELGPVYYKEDNAFVEEHRLALAFWGEEEGIWQSLRGQSTLFLMKTKVESFLKKVGAKSWRWDDLLDGDVPSVFHPGQVAVLNFEGKAMGVFGSLHPQVAEALKVKNSVALGEFHWDRIMKRWPRAQKFKSLGRFPGTERDISVLMSTGNKARDVLGAIRKKSGAFLKEAWVHDIYEGGDLASSGQRSITFRLYFESEKRTLTDEDVNPVLETVRSHLSKDPSLEIR